MYFIYGNTACKTGVTPISPLWQQGNPELCIARYPVVKALDRAPDWALDWARLWALDRAILGLFWVFFGHKMA